MKSHLNNFRQSLQLLVGALAIFCHSLSNPVFSFPLFMLQSNLQCCLLNWEAYNRNRFSKVTKQGGVTQNPGSHHQPYSTTLMRQSWLRRWQWRSEDWGESLKRENPSLAWKRRWSSYRASLTEQGFRKMAYLKKISSYRSLSACS